MPTHGRALRITREEERNGTEGGHTDISVNSNPGWLRFFEEFPASGGGRGRSGDLRRRAARSGRVVRGRYHKARRLREQVSALVGISAKPSAPESWMSQPRHPTLSP